MGLGVSIFYFLCFIYYLFAKRDIFHPAVITLGVWGGLLLLYNLINHPLYELSNYFYFIVSLWIIPFLVACFIVDHIRLAFIRCKFKLKCNEKLLNFLFPFFIIIVLFVIYETVTLSGTFDYNGVVNKIRESIVDIAKSHQDFPLTYRISKYLLRFVYVGLICYISCFEKIPKTKIFILSILLIISFFITGAKGSLISFFVMLVYWLLKKYNWNLKRIILLFLLLLFLIALVQLYRHANISIGEMDYGRVLLIYAFSPFPALDSVILGINQFPVYSWGGYVFESLSPIINLFTLYIPDIDQNYNRWV